MPERISYFIDSFWQWIVAIFMVGGGAATAKSKLVTKKELKEKCEVMKEEMAGVESTQEKRLDRVIDNVVFKPECNAKYEALQKAISDQKDMTMEIRGDIKNILREIRK